MTCGGAALDEFGALFLRVEVVRESHEENLERALLEKRDLVGLVEREEPGYEFGEADDSRDGRREVVRDEVVDDFGARCHDAVPIVVVVVRNLDVKHRGALQYS